MVMKLTRKYLYSRWFGLISKPETKCINFENIHRQKSNGTEDELIGFIIDGSTFQEMVIIWLISIINW